MLPGHEDFPTVTLHIDPARADDPGFLPVASNPVPNGSSRTETAADDETWAVSAALFSRESVINTCSSEGNAGGGGVGMNPPKTVFYEPHLEVRSSGSVRVTIIAGTTEVASRVIDARANEAVVLQWPERSNADSAH
jgi:hypothetical protein